MARIISSTEVTIRELMSIAIVSISLSRDDVREVMKFNGTASDFLSEDSAETFNLYYVGSVSAEKAGEMNGENLNTLSDIAAGFFKLNGDGRRELGLIFGKFVHDYVNG